ncbi:MAG: histidine kinase, partial [Bacteroidales bacterium]|nr:histidine kinase [Bacteroidales bacterium]
DTRTKMFHNYYHDPQEPSSLSDNTINCIYEDSQGNLWIGTNDGGLNLYNRKNDGFISFEHNVNNTNSLSNNRILTICESHAGTLWIGTFKGVSKIDNKSSKFTVYRNDPGTENSLNNNFVRDFIEMDTGLIWIATDGGINIFNEDTDDFTYITKQAGNKNSLSSNYIRDMYLDNDGFVWLGTSDSGLMKINRNGKVLKKYIHDVRDSTSLSGSFITYISMDRDGDLWVATNNGLSRLKNGTDRFVNYNISLDDESTDKFVRIYDMYQHEDGRIWFASQNGLTQYFPEQDSFSSIYIDPVLEGQIASNKLFSIRRQNDSIFWLGTRGGGLVKFNTYSNTFNIYTEEDGLPNNVVYGFLTDDRENFWISTNWGLSRFNPDQESFVNYDAKDGLQSYEFNGNALLKASNGKMYFGGMNGFNCFYPGEIKTNTNIPPIEITSFKVFNEALPYAQLQKDSIYLNHDDNFFSFEFAALDYTNPSKNKYRYKLEGVDKDWRETDASKPAAEYTKVSPGTYTFRVIGSNNDGYWNYEGKELTIIISPAWWNSWAFRVPVILLVFGLLSYFLYFRFKSIRKEHEAEKRLLSIEKQMFDIEQKALQLQMNPHFIFNSLNSIQSFVISNDTDKAINYLAKFSHLMRLILANSRETYVPLKDELTALKHYMDIEKLRFDDKFDYEINISREIDEEFYEIPPMLLQPYVENAIIHGLINSEKKGRINISFNLEGGKIHCFIEDNGIGREQSEILKKQSGFNRKSRGLMITKERLELLSKQQKQKFSVKIIDLKNSRGEALGTRVELIILFRES